VINFEPPWNPARLEQRIGRVHRLGQSRPVQVIHFLTKGSIEERVWETLRLKKSLFAGVFDSPAAGSQLCGARQEERASGREGHFRGPARPAQADP